MSTNDKPKRSRKNVTSNPLTNDPEPTPVNDPEQHTVADREPVTPTPVIKSVKKGDFYSLDRIIHEDADYNLIFGERGNGKTYAMQKYAIERFLTTGEQTFLLRRWVEDVKQSNVQNFLDGNLISQLSDMSDGRFTTVLYRNNWFFMAKYDDKGKPILDESNRFMFVWNVNESERLKGQSFPNVTTVIYEEFISLSNQGYIPNELTLFLNILSTIIRDRVNVKIWMLGNTVNPYNPYFEHFGIKGLDLKQGDIATKYDAKTGCKVAIEFCAKRNKGSSFGTSEKYFAFGTNSGVTDMITTGKWQIPDVPKCKFNPRLSVYRLGVTFDDKWMIVHLMRDTNKQFLFVQAVKDHSQIGKNWLVLDLVPNPKPNYYTSFANIPQSRVSDTILDLLNNNKIWFDDNLTGSYFNNFISQSNATRRII